MNSISLKKNMILNIIKQLCTTVFPLITFTYASHVLGTEKIGIHSFGQSVVSYAAYIGMFGISDYAIREAAVARKDKRQLEKFSNEIFSINLLSTIVAYSILFTLLGTCANLFPYRYVILIQSLQIILTTLGADWINLAFEDFLYITIRYVIVELICVIAMVILVKDADDLYLYTFISMLSAAGGNILNIFYIRKYIKLRPTWHMNLKKHLPFMSMLFFNSIALVIYLSSDVTILGVLKGNKTVGIYSVSTKIYLLIKALINATIMVMVPRLSSMLSEKSLKEVDEVVSKLFNLLLMIIIPCMAGMFSEAENIIHLIAGEDYVSGDISLRIYAVTIFFAVVSCFISYIFLIPNRLEKFFLISTVIAAIVNIGLNFILIPRLSLNGAAITTLIAEIIVMSITSISAKRFTKSVLLINKADLLKDILGGITIVLICTAIHSFTFSYYIELFVSMFFSTLIYLCIEIMLSHTGMSYLVSIFARSIKKWS